MRGFKWLAVALAVVALFVAVPAVQAGNPFGVQAVVVPGYGGQVVQTFAVPRVQAVQTFAVPHVQAFTAPVFQQQFIQRVPVVQRQVVVQQVVRQPSVTVVRGPLGFRRATIIRR